MNKDVLYIEPEDDITDIITRIEGSKEKIVALVPPKKAGVFRSVVNIKLIAKAGASAEKTIVLVTTDPSIVKLAATVKLPVTKNLQTAPTIPEEEVAEEAAEAEIEEVVEEAVEEVAEAIEAAEEAEEAEGAKETKEAAAEEKAEKKSDKKDTKKEKKDGKFLANAENPFLVWLRDHTGLAWGIGAGIFALILIAVWAFVIAPAATITIGIRTKTENFSENVTFTTNAAEEDGSAGKFYLTEHKVEDKTTVEFEATGKKNVGEKAAGTVVVYAFFKPSTDGKGGSKAINAGSTFSTNGLSFVSTEDITLAWDGNSWDSCDNRNSTAAEQMLSGCQVSGRVSVVATESGEKYNIGASRGWTTTAGVTVYSDEPMTGGTDKTVTVVQQSDIEKALAEIETSNESENKEKLAEITPEDDFVIESSFAQKVGEGVSTPKVGEEVKDGEKAKLEVTTTATISTIDKVKVEEFIAEKAKLTEGYKIYSINNPFIENFSKTEAGFIGKLKTSYVSGPEVTENDIVEMVKGKGFGAAQHDLKSINGIGTVTIQGSLPWVTSIPGNVEKITVILETSE